MTAATPDTLASLAERYGPGYRWLVVFTCLMASLGMVLASVSMNVAVPSVMGAFGVGQDQAQWIATGYLATMVIGMLLNSWLVAAFGLRMTLMLLIAVFLAASAIGAFSTSIEMLVLGRILQGIPAGVIQPFCMMINFQIFPPERRGTAMGIFGMGVVLAPVFGPLLGGIAIDTLGWRYIFAMPLPFIVVAIVLGPIFLPERPNKGPWPKFDWTGLALLAVSLVLVLTALTSGQRLGWSSDFVLGRGVLGFCSAFAFVWWERRAPRPLLDFSLFRNPRFACAMAVSFTFGVCMFSSSYVVPVFAQIIQGYSAMKAGWLLAMGGSVMIIMFPLSGRVSDTFPPHLLITSGLMVFSFGFFLISWVDVNTGFMTMALLSAFTRIGLSWVLTPLNATALRNVPAEKLANASSNANFFRQLGGGMGIAILVAILETRTTFHANSLTATQTPANATSGEALQVITNLLSTTGIPEVYRQFIATDFLGRVVFANANMFGFQDVFLTLAGLTLIAAIPAWFVRSPKPTFTLAATSPSVAVPKPEAEPEATAKPRVPQMPPAPAVSAGRYLLHRRASHRNPARLPPLRSASRRQTR